MSLGGACSPTRLTPNYYLALADGAIFRLTSEAYRINLAYLFDPLIAVHTSLIEPLPHQITAVYETMLSKQPLRYLLADDPGAGKTIMTGLLIKELMIRGDLHRCLIVAPGNLVERWQDELNTRFHLVFDDLDDLDDAPYAELERPISNVRATRGKIAILLEAFFLSCPWSLARELVLIRQPAQ